MELARLRLFDFFLVFPHILTQMRLPKRYLKMRKVLKAIPSPYESTPSPTRLFYQIGEIQKTTVRLLVARTLIQKDIYLEGDAALTDSINGATFGSILNKQDFRNEGWYHFLVRELIEYPLDGPNGLKHRTGLMEFRHDSL